MGWIAARVFDRHLWRVEQRGICLGLGLGVFCALLPIPLQMVLASILCIWKRANIPIAVVACWLSPPVTPFLVVLPAQVALGHWIFDSLGLPSSGLNFDEVINLHPKDPDFLRVKHGIVITQQDAFRMVQEAIIGVAVSASAMGYLAYVLCRGVWSFFLHHRVERWKQDS